MRLVSAALRAAIDAGERVVRGTLTVDWDQDGIQDIDDLSHKVNQISVTQSLESSVPAPVQVVPGVAVAQLKATIARGNAFRYDVPATFRSLTTSTNANATTQWSIAKPATAQVGDVLIVGIFISGKSGVAGASLSQWDILRSTNASWVVIGPRGDGTNFASASFARVEGVMLQRRITATDPATYTLDLPTGSSVMYASAAVNIGQQNIMGIVDVGQKGEDSIDTATSITTSPVDVQLPGSTIVSFFATASYAVTGLGFTPGDPANDVEQSEFSVTSVGNAGIRVAVVTSSNVPVGRYLKSVNITGTTGLIVSTLGFTFVLAPKLAGDERQHAAWTFSELNPDSPYAGKTRARRPTKWSLGFVTENGFESVPLFTGYTSTSGASSRGRTATIEALDNRENMRNANRGMNIVAEYPITLDFITHKPTLPGLDATWMISYLFSHAFFRSQLGSIFIYETRDPVESGRGYFAGPPLGKYSFMWVPMHGSAHPFYGGQVLYAYTEVTTTGARKRVEFDVGPFVSATRNQPVGTNTYAGWFNSLSTTMWNHQSGQIAGRAQFYVRRNQTTSSLVLSFLDGQTPTVYSAWVEILTTGVVRFRVELPGVSRTITGPTITADGLWHFVGVHFDSVSGSVTFRVDTTNTVVVMTTWADTIPGGFLDITTMQLSDGMQLSDLQAQGSYISDNRFGIPVTQAWANEGFTPSAFIDKSENILDCVPLIDKTKDTWSIVADIAAAEFAAAFFDADGFPHYRTARSDVTTVGQTVQKTVSARRTIQDMSYESGITQIRNVISVGYTKFVAIINQQAFSVNGAIYVLAGQTVQFTVVLDGPLILIDSTNHQANSLPDGSGTDLTFPVDVSSFPGNAGEITVTIFNSSGQTAWLVDNTGNPSLTVFATWMSPINDTLAPITYADDDSIRKYGEQPLLASGTSVWVQREESAASIALKLISDLSEAHPIITQLPIKGDPTLEFGDRVILQDVNGLGVNGSYRITTKDPSFTPDGGFTQDLVVREAANVAFWGVNFWDDGTVWG